MPQDQLAHDLNRRPSSRCIGGSVPAKVMRADLHSHEHASLSHDNPRGGIGDRKDPFIGPDLSLYDVRLETLRNLLSKEDQFGFLAALWIDQGNSSVLDILTPQTKDLSNAHTAPGHEFEDQPVSGVLRPENHLIDYILVEDGPLLGLGVTEDFPENGRVAGIGEAGIEDVFSEVEEGRQERVSELLGPLAPSICLLREKAPDLVGGQRVQLAAAELVFKLGKEEVVIPDGIFFCSWLSGTRRTVLRPWLRSWRNLLDRDFGLARL